MKLFSSGSIAYVLLWTVCLTLATAQAEDSLDKSSKSLEQMSLEELLDVKVSVASHKEETTRTSPGIVTVITSEQIAAMGARDLTDVLIQVPGFSAGLDVEGVTSVGVRGNWAEEGKALLIWDGAEINEGLYGNLPLGNHFPVDQIDKIEIIRGAGSVIYGGFAELAVIKVTTKGAAGVQGVGAHTTYTQMPGGYGRRNFDLGISQKVGELEYSLMGFIGEMRRSTRDYTDVNGDTYNLADNAHNNPAMINVGAKYKGFEFRGLVDRYHTTQRDAYGQNISAPVDVDFDSYFLNFKYNAPIAQSMTLTPFVDLKYQWSWMATEPVPQVFEIPNIAFKARYVRYKEGIRHSWDITPQFNLLTGFELYQDESTVGGNPDQGFATFMNNSTGRYFFNDRTGYTQGVWTNEIVNVTAGIRVDNHNVYGTSVVPRLALTKQLSDWNFKFLLSRAYRAPVAMNIDSNPSIRPEHTTETELEAGYRVTEDLFATLNLFNINISDPIIYSYDPVTDADIYKNYDTAGTRGLEFEVKSKKRWGYIDASYSYYRPITSGVVSYSVPSETYSLLGMPNHKIAMNSNFVTPIQNLKVSPNLVWFSTQWAYTGVDSTGAQTLSKLPPTFLLNLYAYYDDFLIKRLRLGAGVSNLLNNNYPVVQPFTNPSSQANPAIPHPPMAAPGSSREAIFKLSYDVPI